MSSETQNSQRILRWVQEEEERVRENNRNASKCIILDMIAVTTIDTSGLETLGELRKMLEKRSLQFVLVNSVGNVMEKLDMSKILDSFGLKGVYLTVGEALADISTSEKDEPCLIFLDYTRHLLFPFWLTCNKFLVLKS
ncbi:unnamed protein product [Vicia faba]|uniref:STAS domain-containing protein n=1 Tax=Vicia faba TaxID=3906 RepID=A0AAV0YQD1_VICFA|nr:unnamed protein product [Vicia faba]